MPIVLLTLEEAAGRYNLDVEHLRQMVAANKIKSVVVDGHTLVDEAEVRRVTGKDGNHLHWMPLSEAARLYSLEEALLELLAKEGKVRSGVLDGEMQVALEDVEALRGQLDKRNFQHLEGSPISMSEAARRYAFPVGSIFNWVRKGYIRVLGTGTKEVFVNESDVAYARVLANIRGLEKGKALFPISAQYRSSRSR